MAKRGPSTPPGTPARIVQRVRHPASSLSKPKAAKERARKVRAKFQDEAALEDLQAVFGENLRAARIACGLTQSEVAERTGVTQQYLSLIEAGQQNLTLKTMLALAKVVDNDVSAMLQSAKLRRGKK